ncbi:hypothetical protein [Rhizobium phage RHEph18]|uniref:hypothetical protein n=1 Tax=Rhizobium TaxID=379 RepID=UPI0007EBF12F|nr:MULTISPECIES: hypothetical protein [Rhizobium]ANL02639.1 hypothetical protein AMJ99_CH01052 [Rhizobium esperanzae]ANM33491.1 hypothetical protein AMK04_CH01053 [Rhizobium sp. N871]QIG73722.1 hypothetical protein EVC05_030 [Rhizobium phage RHph_N2]QXV74440.1 hypothetical protein [Rhizobium phage RHEph18]
MLCERCQGNGEITLVTDEMVMAGCIAAYGEGFLNWPDNSIRDGKMMVSRVIRSAIASHPSPAPGLEDKGGDAFAPSPTPHVRGAADAYVAEQGIEHSGGIIERAFEAGALWARLRSLPEGFTRKEIEDMLSIVLDEPQTVDGGGEYGPQESTDGWYARLEELDALLLEAKGEIERLTGIGSAHDLISDWLGEGVEDLPDDTPVNVHIGGRCIIHDKLGELRAAIIPQQKGNADGK